MTRGISRWFRSSSKIYIYSKIYIDYSMNNNSYFKGMKAIVSEKGQVTIPQKIREELGLKAGQVLEFEAREGLLVARKSMAAGSLDEVVGILRKKVKDADSYLEEIRGPKKR